MSLFRITNPLRLLATLFALLAALILAGCGNSVSWHQRMTVILDTPEGERKSSSVISLQASGVTVHIPGITGSGFVVGEVRGEAVVLDLGDGRYLFALLKGETGTGDVRNNARYAFSDDRNKGLAELDKVAALPSGTRGELVGSARPLLVTFDDITDPATVRKVDPQDLAATFGEGYALKSVTLEITNDPVTKGKVETVLGWICAYRGQYLVDRYGKDVTNDFARNLGAADFRLGECP